MMLNILPDFKPYHVDEIPITNRETYDLLDNIHSTNVNRSLELSTSWSLQKAFIIQNKSFEREFNEKREEIRKRSYYSDHWDARFGFLATNKLETIDKLAEEGLEINLCPYNFLGHCTSGVHISMNADVCMNEARSKYKASDEITLIVFKFMLGKRKMVPMYDQKILLAPSPNFDSHVCEERPIPNEKNSVQYIKSLVYLYEFSNELYCPVNRPRHCVPIGALHFKNLEPEILDLTESESVDTLSFYNKNPLLSSNKTNVQMFNSPWNPAAFSNFKHDENIKESEPADTLSFYSKNPLLSSNKTNIQFNSSWNAAAFSKFKNDETEESSMLKSFNNEIGADRSGLWKDNKFERNNNWKDGISIYGGQKYNNLLSSRLGKIN